MQTLRNPIIIKLGGSVITHKKQVPPRTDKKNLSRIAKELQKDPGQKIIVLGGGAHGHQTAHAFGYGNPETPRSRLMEGLPKIRHSMSVLALEVEEELNKQDAKAVVIPPFTQAVVRNGQILEFPLTMTERILQSGLSVITHGDVCLDLNGHPSILSGDTIIAHIARNLESKKVLIGTDVDGIYDSNPESNKRARLIPIVDTSNAAAFLSNTGPSSSTDVTGGMSKKLSEVIEIAKAHTEVVIFNLSVPGRLAQLLLGEPVVCTRIVSSE